MSRSYNIRAARRERERQRALCGETLAEHRARATAAAPTLAQVFAENHRNRERCPWSVDLEELLGDRQAPDQAPRRGRHRQPSLF